MNTYDNQLVLAGIVCFLLLVTVYGEGKSGNHEKKTLVMMIWMDEHQRQGYRITLYIIMHAVRWLNKKNVVNDSLLLGPCVCFRIIVSSTEIALQ